MSHLVRSLWRSLQHRSAPLIIVGIGLVVRLVILLISEGRLLVTDAQSYHAMALQLLHGERFAPFWPPGFPYWLACFYSVFGAHEGVGRASMLLFYLMFSSFAFLLTRRLTSARFANLTILFFAFYPAFVFHSIEPLTQLPSATLLVGIAYLSLALIDRPRWGHAIALGFGTAALVLTRASSVLFVVAIPLYLYVRTKSARTAFVVLLVSSMLVVAWTLKAHAMTGRWIMVNDANVLNLFFGNNPYTPLYKTWWIGSHTKDELPAGYDALASYIQSQPEDQRGALYFKTALHHMATRPDLFCLRTANRIRTFFAFDTVTGAFLITGHVVSKATGLVVIGLDALSYCVLMLVTLRLLFELRPLSLQAKPVLFLLAMVVLYAAPYSVSFAHPSYHMPVVPLFGVVSAALAGDHAENAKSEPWSWMPSGNRKRAFLWAVLAFVYIQIEWIFVMQSRL